MFAELRARAWQFGALGLGALALILAISLTVVTLQKNAAEDRGDKLHAEIHDPVTGYEARLRTCRGNVGRLEQSLEVQGAAVNRLREESAERLAAAQAGLAAAQRAAAEARVRADRLTNSPITGSTVCERVEDVDRMVLESLR